MPWWSRKQIERFRDDVAPVMSKPVPVRDTPEDDLLESAPTPDSLAIDIQHQKLMESEEEERDIVTYTPDKISKIVYRKTINVQENSTSARKSRNFLSVLVNGEETLALPDTMARTNVITEEYAKSQGVFIDRHPPKRQVFINAVGKPFESVGQATLLLSFADTPGKVFSEVFAVVVKCAASIVLGDSFLRSHEILTRFRHRLKKVAVTASKAWRLMQMDIPYQKFICRFDAGGRIAVNVDTGSEKDFISSYYLWKCCWQMRRLPPDRGFVELADGKIVQALGYVDKHIVIGQHSYETRFYVLDELMCDVLLGDETIENTDLYNEAHNMNWVDSETSANYFEFHAIGWLDKIEDHVSEFLNNPTYQVSNRYMQELLNEVQRQGNTSTTSSPKRQRKWWEPRQISLARRQTRVDEQYQLLLSGIWIKLGKLDNTELEAREAAGRAMSKATGDDLRRMQSQDDTRRQQHIDKRTHLLELRSKLLEWKASKATSTP